MRQKIRILFVIFISCFVLLSSIQQGKEPEEFLVVYYFSATNFGVCQSPEIVGKIKKIKSEFPKKHNNIAVKFVFVCLDKDVESGLKLMNKYGKWDEISIGQAYHNELAMIYLNRSKIPGIPHILVYKDLISKGRWFIPLIKNRKLLVDLSGVKQISEWMRGDYKIE